MRMINQPVDVIAISDKSGKLVPIKFRLQDENGEPQAYYVKVIIKDVEQQGKELIMMKFNCRFRDGVIEKSCELHYRVLRHGGFCIGLANPCKKMYFSKKASIVM